MALTVITYKSSTAVSVTNPSLQLYPEIFLEELRATTRNRFPGQDFIPRPSKYEAGVLHTRPAVYMYFLTRQQIFYILDIR
jgi:hypothetical protein